MKKTVLFACALVYFAGTANAQSAGEKVMKLLGHTETEINIINDTSHPVRIVTDNGILFGIQPGDHRGVGLFPYGYNDQINIKAEIFDSRKVSQTPLYEAVPDPFHRVDTFGNDALSVAFLTSGGALGPGMREIDKRIEGIKRTLKQRDTANRKQLEASLKWWREMVKRRGVQGTIMTFAGGPIETVGITLNVSRDYYGYGGTRAVILRVIEQDGHYYIQQN